MLPYFSGLERKGVHSCVTLQPMDTRSFSQEWSLGGTTDRGIRGCGLEVLTLFMYRTKSDIGEPHTIKRHFCRGPSKKVWGVEGTETGNCGENLKGGQDVHHRFLLSDREGLRLSGTYQPSPRPKVFHFQSGSYCPHPISLVGEVEVLFTPATGRFLREVHVSCPSTLRRRPRKGTRRAPRRTGPDRTLTRDPYTSLVGTPQVQTSGFSVFCSTVLSYPHTSTGPESLLPQYSSRRRTRPWP